MDNAGRHRRFWLGAGLAGLLLTGLAPAQQGISVYGGVFRSAQRVSISVSAPRSATFTLSRVPDPQALFLNSRDPHRPTLPAGTRTTPLRTLRLTREGGYQDLDLGRLASGVYLLSSGGVGAIILVSDLGLVVKRDAASALTYTADRDSGRTRPARVWALGNAAPVSASADGVARFNRPPRENEFYLAKSGNDWAVSGAGWNAYAAPLVRGYVYPDRPVYRPGQHVDFKGVLRKAGSLAPLANTAVRVRVVSPYEEEVFRKTLTTNAYGSLSAGLDLPPGAKLGDYTFDLAPSGADGDGQADISGGFTVEAYQKPEYQVTLTPDRARAVQGERARIHISARYLFGGTLSSARVNYNVTRAPYYPPGFDEDSLAPDDEGPDYGADLVVQEETRLNAQGDLDLTLPLEKDAKGQPVSYRIEAEVEDESRRTVSAQTRVIAFPASLNVQAETDGYIYDAGSPIGVRLDTRDLQERGKAAAVTLDLVRQDYDCDRDDCKLNETREARAQLKTDAGGRASTRLRAKHGGGYLLRATVTDSAGRRSTFENFVWVLREGESWSWPYRDMSVRLDKKTYTPGDTATALVGNPHPGAPVLLTLEGDRIRKSVVLRGAQAALSYRFKVTADMSPNIFVGAAALADGNFYSNEARVTVPRKDAALSVRVTPDRARYAPGDTSTLKVQVQDAKGRGVPAELALGVVDQAIYLVKADDATPLTQVFQAPRDNAVGTRSSVDFSFEAGPVAAAPRAAQSDAAFAQSKEEAPAPASPPDSPPRSDFRDTILWIPKLLTDAQGRAQVAVKFPDNLTTWVATARAQTLSPRFGQATASTLVTRDVIARLSLPTFLVRGDRVTLAGVVNNTLGTAVQGTATATLNGLSPLGGAALTPKGAPLKLAPQGRARSDFTVRADRVGTAQVTFGARTPSGSDALKLPLPVKARGYAVTRTAVGGPDTPLTLTVPRDANPDTLALGLNLTPSLLSAVSPALEYLAGYPYGCTEQTMSRFLPALLARQTLGAAALPEGLRKQLPDITAAGLARLALFQHDDGGWNFWQWDDSTLEMTAYVVEGLLRAKGTGLKVDNAMLDHALKYLAANVNDPQAQQAERARALKVLAQAGRAKSEAIATFARRRDLQPYALAELALALQKTGQTQAAGDLVDRLLARRIAGQGGALVHWEKPGTRDWWDYWDDNSVQVTAAALEALNTLRPQSPVTPAVTQWLLAQRRGPQWVSTQDTTSVIIAALVGKKSAPKAARVTVKLDGRDAGSAQLGAAGQAVHLDLKTGGLAPGAHTLTLNGAPKGLSAAAQLSYSREPATLSGDATRGLRLTRRYERLTPKWDEDKQRYTYARTPLLRGGGLQPVTVGDLILVTLSVQPTDHTARYLLLSDPIPAGTRALDDRALSIAGLNDDDDEDDWENSWNFWYAGRDLQDDRVDLYADYLEGRQELTYVLRAQTPGTFTALPSHAFLMYDPDVEGYGPAATLTVRDRGQ